MFTDIRHMIKILPTPLAGLALGIASLGWCLENALPLNGTGQLTGAIIAAILLFMLLLRFLIYSKSLLQDIQHPVIGSILPTFAMTMMVISKAVSNYYHNLSIILWLLGIGLHITFLIFFILYRVKEFSLNHLVPSWFVPPVGLIVADVTYPGSEYYTMALIILCFGMICYLLMLPLMIYRFIFREEISDAAKPTIAILAAPASLSLAGYLTVVKNPSIFICSILLGIAVLMTMVLYISFIKLLKLKFTPGYAAYTFPLVIGSTALYKLSNIVSLYPNLDGLELEIRTLASVELAVSVLIIIYVCFKYIVFFKESRSN